MSRVLAFVLFLLVIVPVSTARAAYVLDVPPGSGQATSTGGPNEDLQRNIVDPAANNVTTGTPSLNTLVNVSLVDSKTGARSSEGLIGLTLWNGVGLLTGIGSGTSSDGKTSMVYPGAIGTTLNMTSIALTHPPVSSTEYIADVMQNIGHPFAQTAYAQGLGFSALSPVLGLWKMFRNVAYFFFIIIFVFIGFLIMIRSKIGSQAAVTVQQALPKLVVSLILVTFSYAIAGLLLDAMYLVIYLIIGIFSISNGQGSDVFSTQNLSTIAFQTNIFANGFALIGKIVGGVAGSIGAIVQGLTTTALGDGVFSQIVGSGIGSVTNVVATLVLAVAILVSLFRVFFALVQAYVGIFFSVIFAPIQLLIGALPGQNTFGGWIKGLFENLMVFPTLILLLFISYYFTLGPSFSVNNPGFSAPQLGTNQGANGFKAYQGLLALGAILAMPEVLKITKGLMKGQLGVGVDDLKKNWDKGKIGQTVGLTGLGVLGGAAGGSMLGGMVGFAKGGGSMRERFSRGARQARTGAILGGAGGGAVSSGVAWKVGKNVVNEGVGAATSIIAGETVDNALDRFDPSNKVGRYRDRHPKKPHPGGNNPVDMT